jgi:hypothetical protein
MQFYLSRVPDAANPREPSPPQSGNNLLAAVEGATEADRGKRSDQANPRGEGKVRAPGMTDVLHFSTAC